ncbi:MAG: SoxR reducing system RseC family protein [Candidatus Cloacimonadaceae bacterium]|jgi:sigma-E factor negative regulatory protein RseC|nr:SoxR reducing system RseC family protein [Candidatus Cloacimonadota bacterium]MDY0127561.1 SoxR reducing system RseC family protein [Candidatus Cloacimonadaceae bacterium]MCB5254596.1 SoxR reducing system RseC family protein [Candidatus Cloacimonadota bacterium]MCK9178247.1 SoxR reducing system RseC family protein [Candidatus Cloacimonadota bacterium]MCK9242527.1 SoxR reducing system RseC family protein [Candidatus Cloacimonadota bacterium]
MPDEEIQDKGLVTAMADGIASVEVLRGGGCSSCSLHGICFSKNTPAVFQIQTELPLQVGDEVELSISAEGRVLASLLVFGMPVLFLMLGFWIANRFLAELPSIILAFSAMVLSFFIIKLFDRRWEQKFKIEIMRKL